VGAISSLGKTTFCTQLADQLAEAGEDVLFFSLEQSRLELVSKSLARRTAQKNIETAVDSLSIRRGYLPKQVLTEAAEYKQAIQDRLSIIEGNFQCNISFIGEYIRRYIRENGKKPVVFVDYLQILQPEKDERGRTQTTKETVDNTVTELKRISRENGLTVFVISSLNRSNYLSPVDFESFKESGGIEYTADVVWGLQLQSMNDKLFETDKKTEKRKAIKAAKAANPRKIELVCLKNRYGISNYSAYFDYYPQYDLYQETATPDYSLVTDDQEADYKPKKATKTI
jgi:replicative DNA helicase